jgi:hypothetical protein
VPDLVAMLKRRSSADMNPRMTAIMGAFQVLWVYYGLLILSRPVIAWNLIAVLINFLSVGAYLHSSAKKKPNQRGCLGVDGAGRQFPAMSVGKSCWPLFAQRTSHSKQIR